MEELELVVCFQVDVLHERVLIHVFHSLAQFDTNSFDVIRRYSCNGRPIDFKTRKPSLVTHCLVDTPFLIHSEVALPFVSEYCCFLLNVVSG